MSKHMEFLDGTEVRSAEVEREADQVNVRLDGDASWTCLPAGSAAVDVLVDGRRRRAWVARRDGERLVFLDGVVHEFRLPLEEDEDVTVDLSGGPRVCSEMPGTIVKILVGVGDKVVEGDPLLIMEAMKMETEVKAPMDGTIEEIAATEGTTVGQDDLLIVVDPAKKQNEDA